MDNNLTELAEMNHRFDVVKSDVKDMSLNKINQQLEWVKPYVWWHEHAHLRIIVILFFFNIDFNYFNLYSQLYI